MPEIYINDKKYPFNEGDTVLEVAKRNNIYIPVMCYLDKITPTGACRFCLVEIEGIDKPAAACVTYAMDGMKVFTDTEKVIKDRKRMMDFVLIKHPLDCPICDKAGECMLQDMAYEFGINEESVPSVKPDKAVFDWNFIINDTNLCVMCERCVKVCHEITGCSALKIEERGFNNIINTTDGAELDCDFCGLCVDYCPVGALLDKPYKHSVRSWDLDMKNTFCNLCPVGCEIEVDIHDNEIFRCRSTENSFICSLGRYAFKHPEHKDRVETPLMKNSGRFSEVSWDDALGEFRSKINNIKERYGDESIALLVGSRLSNEALFGYKKLSDALNISKVVSDVEFESDNFYKLHKEKFNTYENIGSLEGIKNSDLIFVIGSDLANEALGVKWNVMNAVIHNNAKLVTIGAQKYEYDYFTDASLLADYGDYAGIFENIKTDGGGIPASIREYIDQAQKVTFIVGNEYISAEKQPESVYAFYDYVGSDKVENFFLVSDKTNVTALLNSGILDNGYTPAKLNKDMVNSKIKAVLAAGFYPSDTYGAYKALNKSITNLDMLVSVDIYKNRFNSDADIILPALTSLENESSYTSMDGKIFKTDVVHEQKYSSLSDVEILSKISGLFGVDLPESASEFWNEHIAGQNGYPQLDFYEIDGYVRKESNPNINKTAFSYQEPAQGSVEIFVNARYHNNYLSTKAIVEKDLDGYVKKYYFDVDETVLSGKDACYDGHCSINDEIAKGTVLIPKNLK